MMRRLVGLLLLLVLTPASLAMAPIQRWQTANGAWVYFVPAPEVPMLDVRVVFAAGSARDGDNPGLATLTAAMLDEGTESLKADDFHAAMEATGANFGAGSGLEMASLSLRTLSEAASRDAAYALLAAVLRQPRFSAEPFARQRSLLLSGLQSEQESPGAIADHAYMRALYGQHPFGSPGAGTLASVQAISLPMVKAFHGRYFVATNARLIFVGDASRAEIERLAEQLSQAVPAGAPAPPLPVVHPQPASAQHIAFDSAQTHVLLGELGIARGDPDHFALILGNHVLGGNGVVSVLFKEVREKRGLSYSVNSHFEPLGLRGPFTASLQTRGEQQAEAVALLRREIALFVDNGPDPKALEEARQNLLGDFPLRLDGNGKILDNLTMMAFYGLPLDYLDTWRDKIKAVTLTDVRAALKRHLHPEAMTLVTVGREPPKAGTPAHP